MDATLADCPQPTELGHFVVETEGHRLNLSGWDELEGDLTNEIAADSLSERAFMEGLDRNLIDPFPSWEKWEKQLDLSFLPAYLRDRGIVDFREIPDMDFDSRPGLFGLRIGHSDVPIWKQLLRSGKTEVAPDGRIDFRKLEARIELYNEMLRELLKPEEGLYAEDPDLQGLTSEEKSPRALRYASTDAVLLTNELIQGRLLGVIQRFCLNNAKKTPRDFQRPDQWFPKEKHQAASTVFAESMRNAHEHGARTYMLMPTFKPTVVTQRRHGQEMHRGSVSVRFLDYKRHLVVEIEDSGRGFDPHVFSSTEPQSIVRTPQEELLDALRERAVQRGIFRGRILSPSIYGFEGSAVIDENARKAVYVPNHEIDVRARLSFSPKTAERGFRTRIVYGADIQDTVNRMTAHTLRLLSDQLWFIL